MQTQQKTGTRHGDARGSLFVHLLGFVVCIGVPIFWTAIAPVAVTHLTRKNGAVMASSSRNLLFVIPYQRTAVDDVRTVDDRIHAGQGIRRRPRDSRPEHRAEDEAFLILNGAHALIEVPVSPVNLRSTLEKTRAFLGDPSQQHLRLITVANWKFSVIFATPLVLLAALYAVGVVLGIIRWMARSFQPRKTISSPLLPQRDYQPVVNTR